MGRIRNLVRLQRSLVVVITATLAGLAYPGPAAHLRPILPVLVAGLVFTAFYGFRVEEIAVQEISLPVVVSIACLYLIVPISLYPIAATVLSGEILLGVLVVLSAPLAAGSSIIWTRLSGGNTFLSTIVVLISMLLAPIAMPSIITFFADSAVELSASELFAELAAIVLAAGVLASLVPSGIVSDERLDDFSVAAMGTLIYVGVGGSSRAFDPFQLAVVGGIAVAALGVSVAIAYALHVRGMPSDDCITVLFASSMKNLSVSVVAGATLGGGGIVASITAFHVAQQLVSSSLVHRLEKAAPSQSTETVTAGRPGD